MSKRELRIAWAKLAKTIGPGVKISREEQLHRWQGWKDGKYDPRTGVWNTR